MRGVFKALAGGGAIGLSGIVGLAHPSEAAGLPSEKECAIIAAVAVKTLRAIGAETLSPEFKQSFRDWLGPDLRCDGPRDIATPTVDDVAIFNTIAGVLLQGDDPISLRKFGVRAVVRPKSG